MRWWRWCQRICIRALPWMIRSHRCHPSLGLAMLRLETILRYIVVQDLFGNFGVFFLYLLSSSFLLLMILLLFD